MKLERQQQMADELGHFTERQQALINVVELGIDYGLEVAPEDIEEYHRLTGSSCSLLKERGYSSE